MSNSLRLHGLCSSWNSPGQNTGVGSCSLFQRIFQTQGLVTKGEMALEGRRDKLEVSHSDQFSSVTQSCPTLCDSMDCNTPGLPVHHQLLEFSQTHVYWVSDAIQPSHLCRPLLLLPSILPNIRVFSDESVLSIRWPKYWSFSFNISPSNDHPGLISFRMDWLDLLAVQGTLKSLIQYHSSKASILQCLAFFIVQHSLPYMTTGKNHSLNQTDLCWQSNVSAF